MMATRGRRGRRVARASAMATTLLLLVGLLAPIASANGTPAVIRYGGSSRYGTAAAIANGDFPNPVTTVFVAVGTNFPDALAGAAVAGKLGAPLLLVTGSSIPAQTAAELTRLDPDTIVILGGTAVISNHVQIALGAYATTVTRLAGASRFETAVKISQFGFPVAGSADTVIVATGRGFADALAGGPAAVQLNGPVLLTEPTSLPSAIAAEIVRLSPDRIIVAGGSAVVSDGVLAALDALQVGDTVERIAGANRWATAVALSQEAFGPGAGRAYIATGYNFPDALAGAAAAGWYHSPVLLVPASSIPGNVSAEITRLGATEIVLLGGRGVVTTGVQTAAAALIGAVTTVNTDLTNSPPQGFQDAVAALYAGRAANAGLTMTISGVATFAAAFDGHVGVVTATSYSGTDVVLLASDDGLDWRVAGNHLATLGEYRVFGASPRFVAVIGTDCNNDSSCVGEDPLYNYADSVHIVSLVAAPPGSPTVAKGAIVGFPRDTIVHVPYSHGPTLGYCTGACDQLNHTTTNKGSGEPKGPATTVAGLEMETGIDLEGYFHTTFGSAYGAGPGFRDVVDAFIAAYTVFTFLVPYDAGGGQVTEGQPTVNGLEALIFARERSTRPRGDIDRTLAQGLLIKAAIANVQPFNLQSTPGLLGIMDGYVSTDLTIDQVLTFAATVFFLDPGPMPTLTALDLETFEEAAYNLNPGSIPNVVVAGCNYYPTSAQQSTTSTFNGSFAFWLDTNNRTTLTDLQDGILSSNPIPCVTFP